MSSSSSSSSVAVYYYWIFASGPALGAAAVFSAPVDMSRGKRLHTRDKHPRNHRGFSAALSDGCSLCDFWCVTFCPECLSATTGFRRRPPPLIHMYVYIYIYIYMYTYMYMYRERER